MPMIFLNVLIINYMFLLIKIIILFNIENTIKIVKVQL